MNVNKEFKFEENLPESLAAERESSGPATRACRAFDGGFFDNHLAEDFLEEVTALRQRPSCQDQVAYPSQSKRNPLSLESQIYRLHAIVVLAIDRVGDSQDGRKRGNEISLFW